jgi:hypothetical protein
VAADVQGRECLYGDRPKKNEGIQRSRSGDVAETDLRAI